MELKDNLKAFRKKSHLTQHELAEKMNLKQYNISDYEVGRIEPSVALLVRYADVFGVTVDELVGHTTETRGIRKKHRNEADSTLYKLENELRGLSDDDRDILLSTIHFTANTLRKAHKESGKEKADQ